MAAGSDSVSAHATDSSASGWAAETDVDAELVSATCPNCQIVIAEAATDSLADLTAAVAAAISANATVVNASFGAPESAEDHNYGAVYDNAQNVKIVASAGDWGYGVYFPASDPGVVAVGATTVSVADDLSVSESAWSNTSSGCSTQFWQRPWQQALGMAGGCNSRMVADIAAVGDPNTGVAVYDSTLQGTTGGWSIFGGTSVSAPIIAGLFALSGDTQSNRGAQRLYANAAQFLNVTSGSDGTCTPAFLCTAVPGYNGPAGIGVPQGIAGF
jgi:subtilase family serine protease